MTLYKWSQTAASNATADSTINYAEGQAPSSLNDSARATMAAVAKYRDDMAGSTVTTGSSTAYAITSNQGFDTLAHLNNQMIAFVPHVTNGATVTLNVDALGAKPLRQAPSVEISAGVLVAGTPYAATYNNSNGEFILMGFFGNPYNVPIGGGMIYMGSTAPNSSFVLPYGQAISRTTYSTLFAQVGTSFGSGDGSTTFNIIDLRGRVPIGQDNMGGTAANRVTSDLSGFDARIIGASGGAQSKTIITANLPPYTPSGSVSTSITAPCNVGSADGGPLSTSSGSPSAVPWASGSGSPSSAVTASSTFTGTAQGGSSTPFTLVQPSVVVPWIVRVI